MYLSGVRSERTLFHTVQRLPKHSQQRRNFIGRHVQCRHQSQAIGSRRVDQQSLLERPANQLGADRTIQCQCLQKSLTTHFTQSVLTRQVFKSEMQLFAALND